MSPTKPTILVVPGSFSPTTIYDSLISHLRTAGFPAVALQLPSTTKRHPLPPATMFDDASVIRAAAEILLAQGKEVVVACHSYGGTPTSQGLAGLAIKRIVYMTAIVPRIGQNQNEAMGLELDAIPMEVVVCIPRFPSSLE
jgi:alpha-beta hydrolase superfamily lysophospholipase